MLFRSFTTFEQRLHLTCASKIRIGVGVTVSYDVMITDIKHSYDDINVRSIDQTIQTFAIVIEDYCFIGAGAKILPGTELGINCIVGANSVVVGKFPSYSVIAGNPARIIKKYNHVTKKWDNKVEF